jgi:hypothetical protein
MPLTPVAQTAIINHSVVFGVYNGALPVTGIASSLSFHTYQDETGAFLTQPAITEIGGGLYKFTPTIVPGHIVAWIIAVGGGYSPTWLAGMIRPEDLQGNMSPASPNAVVFMGTNVSNVPQAALTPTWVEYVDDTGAAITQPTFHEIGNGLYYFVPNFNSGQPAANYMLSTGGSGAVTHYSGRVTQADFFGFAPVLTPVTPTASLLTPTTTVSFTIADSNGIRGAAIVASYDGSNTRELVWDSVNGFNGYYLGPLNQAVPTPGGGPYTQWDFVVLRDGGWPANMTFEVIAYQAY